jgi:hypothetical protein
LTVRDTVAIRRREAFGGVGAFAGGQTARENCEMTPIALRDLAVLLVLAVLLLSVLLALRVTQPAERRRRE